MLLNCDIHNIYSPKKLTLFEGLIEENRREALTINTLLGGEDQRLKAERRKQKTKAENFLNNPLEDFISTRFQLFLIHFRQEMDQVKLISSCFYFETIKGLRVPYNFQLEKVRFSGKTVCFPENRYILPGKWSISRRIISFFRGIDTFPHGIGSFFRENGLFPGE